MATGGEERVIVSLKVNFKGNTVVPWIILPLESNYSVTQLCEKLFSGELSDDKDILGTVKMRRVEYGEHLQQI